MRSVNPHTGQVIREYQPHTEAEVRRKIEAAQGAFETWRETPLARRRELMRRLAAVLREDREGHARLMAEEMGKPVRDGRAEIDKCAQACEYFAENAGRFLAPERIETDAEESFVAFEPLGVVLAVMPWNFPFWQVFRFAAPSLMAGNAGLLKHASNVSGCALAIEEAFVKAGFPAGVFTTLLVESARVEAVIAQPQVRAVTLTGSTPAGRSVASAAGKHLKKSVLELGGSDPYLVLDDADLELAARVCASSRLINAGQSCIAAKRFIVLSRVKEEFTRLFVERFRAVKHGDPLAEGADIGPLARADLREDLHQQVVRSVRAGAKLLVGGEVPRGPGAYYPATVLDGVRPGVAAFDEETFGPVAALIEARDLDEAVRLANLSNFGLGAAVFTRDREKALGLARRLEAGSVFINAFVRSDARLPFGGVKESGYGRELAVYGIREFVNVKTIYRGKAEMKPAAAAE